MGIHESTWSISTAELRLKRRPFYERPSGKDPRHAFLMLTDETEQVILGEIHVLGRNVKGEIPKTPKSQRVQIFNNIAGCFGMKAPFIKAAKALGGEEYLLYLRAEAGRSQKTLEDLVSRSVVAAGSPEHMLAHWNTALRAGVIINKAAIPYDPLKPFSAPKNCRTGADFLLKSMLIDAHTSHDAHPYDLSRVLPPPPPPPVVQTGVLPLERLLEERQKLYDEIAATFPQV